MIKTVHYIANLGRHDYSVTANINLNTAEVILLSANLHDNECLKILRADEMKVFEDAAWNALRAETYLIKASCEAIKALTHSIE